MDRQIYIKYLKAVLLTLFIFLMGLNNHIPGKQANNAENISTSEWTPIGPANKPGRMISLAVDPTNRYILYAGSAGGGLWKTDEIVFHKWKRIRTGFPAQSISAIAINRQNSQCIYLGTGEVYKYKKALAGIVHQSLPGTYGIGILKSEDGGQTWIKSLDWTKNQKRGVNRINFNPQNSDILYAATTEGIYKTFDGGMNWSNIFPIIMARDILINPLDTNLVLVSCGSFASPGSGMYRSTDAGINWSKVNGMPAFTGTVELDMVPTNPNTVYASVGDSLSIKGLYKSYDFGLNWHIIDSTDVAAGLAWYSHWVAVNQQDSNQIIHAGTDLYKSINGGLTFNRVSNQPQRFYQSFSRLNYEKESLYLATESGVFYTMNFGESFTDINKGLFTAQVHKGISCSKKDSSLVLPDFTKMEF